MATSTDPAAPAAPTKGTNSLDPTVSAQLYAGWGAMIQIAAAEANQRLARQSDASQLDNRIYAGVISRMLIEAGDPSNFADQGAAARVPNVVSNPNLTPVTPVVAGKVA